MIPAEVLNSPPATQVLPEAYYPERYQPDDKVAVAAPTVELTVERPYASWSLPQTAADSLAKLGPAAVPVLTPQLRSRDLAQRRQAAEILARVGPDAARSEDLNAVTAIVARVEDHSEDIVVRKGCARALGQIAPALTAVRAPSPPALRPALEPLPALTPAQLADPIMVRAREREQARRDYEAERAKREAQRYAARVQDFRLRQRLAQRAATALLSLASQGAGEPLAAAGSAALDR
jgi:hypothetical protein